MFSLFHYSMIWLYHTFGNGACFYIAVVMLFKIGSSLSGHLHCIPSGSKYMEQIDGLKILIHIFGICPSFFILWSLFFMHLQFRTVMGWMLDIYYLAVWHVQLHGV